MRGSRKSLRESLHRMLIERARNCANLQRSAAISSFIVQLFRDGNVRVVQFLFCSMRIYIYIVPRADFKFCSTKRKSWNVFTGASLFTGLLREILFLLFPSPVRVTIRSYEIAVFPSCSEEKRYIFETIIFIRSKYEPLALMTFSQRDISIDIFHFYKTLWLQWEEILRIQFLEYFIFLKPKRRSK